MPQEIGETRQEMTKDLLEDKLWKWASDAHKDKGLDEFWILISYRPDMYLLGVMREGVVITNRKPPHMLNSMCFHVVWSQGLIESEWILPQDIGVELPIGGCGGHSSLVYDSLNELGGSNILL
jgi:hypothetical protein